MTVLQRLAKLTKPYRGDLYFGVFLAFVSTILEVAVLNALLAKLLALFGGSAKAKAAPLLGHKLPAWITGLQSSLDHAFSRLTTGTPEHFLIVVCLITVVVVFLKSAVHARANYLMNRFSNLMARRVRQLLATHLLGLPPSYYEKEPTGALLTRITGDVVVLQQCLGPQLALVLQAPLTIIVSVSLMMFINLKLMLAALVLAPLIALVTAILGRKIRKVTIRMQEKLAELNAGLIERLSNIRVIQSFVREKHEETIVERFNENYYRETMRSVLLTETLAPSVEFLAWTGMLIGAIVGGMDVLNGHMSSDKFFLFMLLARNAGGQFKILSRINQLRQQATAAGERIFETLDTTPEITDLPSAQVLPPVTGQVVFDKVGFQYQSGEPVLSDISITVSPGEVIALVGPSGSGKTTLVNLLPRFYDPTEGRILIDGQDLRQITLGSLREQVGIVPQETLLFSGTIYENILYGRLTAEREEVIDAARAANALEFIERLPEGFDTLIGERGTRLSGGQRQRLAIARALLKDPRILILDEATSALDTESEHLVQQALDRLMLNRTTFVIAHRLSTVKDASRLLVLHQGRIVESGTHQALLAQGGLYSRLHEMQFKTTETAVAD